MDGKIMEDKMDSAFTWKDRTGVSCAHSWQGYAWTRCPECGDVAKEEGIFACVTPFQADYIGSIMGAITKITAESLAKAFMEKFERDASADYIKAGAPYGNKREDMWRWYFEQESI